MKFWESPFAERRRIFLNPERTEDLPKSENLENAAENPIPEIDDFRQTEDFFLQKARNVHNGLHLGKSLGQIATGRVWQGVSAKRETDILLRKETQKRTGIAEKALAGFSAKIGYFKGAAEKRILEIDEAIQILEKSLAELQKKAPETARIDALRAARYQVSAWRIDKKAKYALHEAGEQVGATTRFFTGNMQDSDFGGITQQRTRETLEMLLAEYQGKKAEYQNQKDAHRTKDENKIPLLGEVLESKPEETEEMLSKYFEYEKEMEIFPQKPKSALELLSQMQLWGKTLADDDSRKKVSEILKKYPKDGISAITEILKVFDGKMEDRYKKSLLLFLKIEKTAKKDPKARRVILDTLDSFSSATRLNLKQKQEIKEKEKEDQKKEKERKEKEQKNENIDQIRKLLSDPKNPLKEKSFCSLDTKGVEIPKDMRFQVEKITPQDEGDSEILFVHQNQNKEGKKITVKVDLKKGFFLIQRDPNDDFGAERSLAFFQISDIKKNV